MKAQILKLGGVTTEAEFYKKYPTEKAFMAKHGKELKKAQRGKLIPGLKGTDYMPNTSFINKKGQVDNVLKGEVSQDDTDALEFDPKKKKKNIIDWTNLISGALESANAENEAYLESRKMCAMFQILRSNLNNFVLSQL
jgi:hypothetical protein